MAQVSPRHKYDDTSDHHASSATPGAGAGASTETKNNYDEDMIQTKSQDEETLPHDRESHRRASARSWQKKKQKSAELEATMHVAENRNHRLQREYEEIASRYVLSFKGAHKTVKNCLEEGHDLMKLLNCSTFRIEEFFGSSMPKSYVVLSHRWEADEVTYQDVVNNHPETLDRKRGWAKIRATCRVALKRGHAYAWVDTCCIDKTSSAEVSEAINSMFKWYADAAVCCAFLSDVGGTAGWPFAESLWFTRGWTLQELIAPREILFFDRDWALIGTGAQLCDAIHARTGISKKILLHGSAPGPGIRTLLSSVPVAVRMSWAATRVTTREEDRAYSLLGIFGVNMPMLYGEGSGAYMRLQEEIIKETNDLSLFAWMASSPRGTSTKDVPEYRDSCKLELSRDTNPSFLGLHYTELTGFPKQYTMTNKGLRIVAEITKGDNDTQLLGLGCHHAGDGSRTEIGLSLEDQGGSVFLRAKLSMLIKLAQNAPRTSHTFYIKKHVEADAAKQVAKRMKSVSRSAIRFHIVKSKSVEILSAVPARMWNPQRLMFITDGESSFTGYVNVRIVTDQMTLDGIVACGFDPEVSMWFCGGWSGRNHDVYNAVMSGDMRKVREIGLQDRGRSGQGTVIKIIHDLEITAAPGKQGFDVSLRQSGCTVM
ncbi:heterokaryon incompatibility protein-domain-containing protein [Colletotrichum cereale]|nr:heterokaryon incompatibility protein-domain-containing protein [Colletotrichum cereale]